MDRNGVGGGPGASTRQRLLDAGQRLFAERGYEGTSLRGLAEAAEANIAAVNYHFRSKEGLLQAVIGRAMAPVNAERDRRLSDLVTRGAPSPEQLVRAFLEPGLDLADHHGGQGPAVARFLDGVHLFDPSPRIRQVFAEQVDPLRAATSTRFAKPCRPRRRHGPVRLHQHARSPGTAPGGRLHRYPLATPTGACQRR